MGFVGRLAIKDSWESTHSFVMIKNANELLLSHLVMSNSLQSHDCSPPAQDISRARILEWLSFPSPGNRPNPEIKSESPTLAGGFFTAGIATQ